MTFEIEINGRTRTVSVESVGPADTSGGRFRIRLDGEVRELDVRTTDLGLSLRYLDGNRTVDAAVSDRGSSECLVELPHVTVVAAVDPRRFRRGHKGPAAGAGGSRVQAPMPGRVVRVLVKPGDSVAARQGLVVIEAMKMENELLSPRAGTVKDVPVTEGQSVESGRLLVALE